MSYMTSVLQNRKLHWTQMAMLKPRRLFLGSLEPIDKRERLDTFFFPPEKSNFSLMIQLVQMKDHFQQSTSTRTAEFYVRGVTIG